jgi:hypothetical protein
LGALAVTPADQLRRRAEALLRSAEEQAEHARQLCRIAEELDGESLYTPPSEWIDTWQAARLTNRTPSTLYRWARRFGIGERTAVGGWRFHRMRTMEIALTISERGENVETGGEKGAGAHLSEEETVG